MSFEAIAWAGGKEVGSAGAKLVLLALSNFADSAGVCWPSQKSLAQWTELCERSVRRHLSALEAAGIILRQERQGPGKYSSDRVVLQMSVGQNCRRTPDKIGGDPGQFVRSAQDKLSAEPVIDINLNYAAERVRKNANFYNPDERDDDGFPAPVADPPEPRPTAPPPILTSSAKRYFAPAEAEAIFAKCFAAAGPGLADPVKCSGLHLTKARILTWLNQGLDLDLDILPVIAARTAKPLRPPITTWSYFDQAVFDQHQRNHAPLPEMPAPRLNQKGKAYVYDRTTGEFSPEPDVRAASPFERALQRSVERFGRVDRKNWSAAAR